MDFEQTTIWPRLLALAARCDDVATNMPPREIYSTAAQMRRAAGSVYANFAEGWGRTSPRDSAHFITMARGSLNEVKAHLLYAQSRAWVEPATAAELHDEIDQLRRIFVSIGTKILSRTQPTS